MQGLIRLIQKTYRMVDPVESRRILNNVALLSWLQVFTYTLPLVILPYLFQTIGPEKFGLIAFAQAFVQYFIILTDYGFSVSATREISLCHDDNYKISRIYAAVMAAKTILLAVSALVLYGLVATVPKFTPDAMVYILSFGAVVGNALFPIWVFQGTEKMKYIAKLNILGELIYAFCIFWFIRGPQDYLMVPLIHSGVLLATGVAAQAVLFWRMGLSFRFPSAKELKHQFKAGWNVFVSVVAINAYTTTRVFAVGMMTNNTLTGFYSIAEKIAGAVQTFPLASFSQAIFPRLSKIFHKSKQRAYEIMQNVQLITIIISMISLPIFFLLSPRIIRLICGADYPAAVLALKFLLISVFFVASNAFRVQFLLVCGRSDIYSRIHIGMAVAGLPLIIFLIHSFSYAGAAMATAAIEACVFTVTWFTVRKLYSNGL